MAVCVQQPHLDLKEIRFTAWIVSIVLADIYGFEFMFSSDSDTLILPNTLDTLTLALTKEPKAGGAHAHGLAHNRDMSLISQMASTSFALENDSSLYRAPLGALGRSEVLPGPTAFFRICAHREAIVGWYQYKLLGKRCVSR